MSGRFNRTINTKQLLDAYEKNGCNAAETSRALAREGISIATSTIRTRLAPIIGDQSNNPDPEEFAKKIAHVRRFYAKLEAAGIDPYLINLDRLVVKEWQMGSKNAEGEPQVTDLEGVSFYASPSFTDGPLWVPVHAADPITVRPSKRRVERRSGEKVVVVATDPQIGYALELGHDPENINASLVPFHDEAAIDVAKQLVGEIRPNRMVHGGDTLDFPEFTRKFRRFPEWSRTTQFSVQRGHRYFAEFAAEAGAECEHDICDGNHDSRISNDTLDNQMAAYGLRPAVVPGETPNNTWPNNSVPDLLQLEYLNKQGLKFRYSAPFPSGRIWLNPHIVFRHDHDIKVKQQNAHVLHGHDHKLHVTWQKAYIGDTETQLARVGCGSLCRNDLVLHDKMRRWPSYVPSGRFEQNWQQGIVIVTYDENGGPDDFEVQTVKILNGEARYGGKKWESRVTVDGKPRG